MKGWRPSFWIKFAMMPSISTSMNIVMITSGMAIIVGDEKTMMLRTRAKGRYSLKTSNNRMYPPPTKQRIRVSWQPAASKLSATHMRLRALDSIT